MPQPETHQTPTATTIPTTQTEQKKRVVRSILSKAHNKTLLRRHRLNTTHARLGVVVAVGPLVDSEGGLIQVYQVQGATVLPLRQYLMTMFHSVYAQVSL